MADKTFYGVGAYKGRVTFHGLTESTEKKTPGIYIRFVVIDIIHAADHIEELDQKDRHERTMTRWLTDQTIEYAMSDLQDMGFSSPKLSDFDLNNQTETTQSFVDNVYDFYCSHEDSDKGDMYERWQLSRGERPMATLSKKQLKQIDNLFGRQMKQSFGGNGGGKPKPQDQHSAKVSQLDESEAPEFDDESIPT